MLLVSQNNLYDYLADHVTALFHFNNETLTDRTVNKSQYGTINIGEGAHWNGVGASAWLSKGSIASYTTNAKFGSHSFSFTGSQRLHYANYAAFPMHRDFTWEAWVYPTSSASNQYIWGRGDIGSASLGSYIMLKSGGNGAEFWYQGSVIATTSAAGTWATDTWQHVAVTRKGSNYTIWINGQSVATGTSSTTDRLISQSTLGGDATAGAFFSGNIDEFRFTKNIARYTQAFTPPTQPFPDYVAYPTPTGNDPLWNNVVLMLHCNGTNGSTTITDSSQYGHSITRTGYSLRCVIQNSTLVAGTTENGRWPGGGLMLNNGYTTSNASSIVLPTHTSFDFSNGDFCIEFWGIRNGDGGRLSYIMSNGSTNLELIKPTGNQAGKNIGRLQLQYNGSTLIDCPDATMGDGYWHHIVIQRTSGTIYMWLDGLLQGSSAFTSTINLSGCNWGRRNADTSSAFWPGNIDDLRITNTSRYAIGDFTPVRGEFPNS